MDGRTDALLCLTRGLSSRRRSRTDLLGRGPHGVELAGALEEGGAGGEEAPLEAPQVLRDFEEPLVGGALSSSYRCRAV